MKLYLLALLAVLVVGCQPAGQQEALTNKDKTEIVHLSLERALVDQEIPDYGLLVEKGDELVLSTENIEDVIVPDVPGFELILLSPQEIQTRANNNAEKYPSRYFSPNNSLCPLFLCGDSRETNLNRSANTP